VVQLCGNDPEIVVKAGRKVEGLCDAIGVCRFLALAVHKHMHEKAIMVLIFLDKKTGQSSNKSVRTLSYHQYNHS